MKKSLSIILTVIMVLGLISVCGSSGEVQESNGNSSEEASETTSSTEVEDGDNETDENQVLKIYQFN